MAASVKQTMDSFEKVRIQLIDLGYKVEHLEVSLRNDEWPPTSAGGVNENHSEPTVQIAFQLVENK